MQKVQTFRFRDNTIRKYLNKFIVIAITPVVIIMSVGCATIDDSEKADTFDYNQPGIHRLQKGNYKDAFYFFNKQARITPRAIRPWIWIGRAHHLAKNYEAANTAYRKAIELKPNESLPHVILGMLLKDQKKYAQARVELEKGLKLPMPSMLWELNGLYFLGVLDVYMTLGIVAYNEGKKMESIRHWKHALEITKKGKSKHEKNFYSLKASTSHLITVKNMILNWKATHWWLGVVNEDLGKKSKARHFYQKAASMGLSSGTRSLAKLKIKSCKKYANKGQTTRKISKVTRKLLVQAKALMKAKKYDKAVKRLNQVVKDAPWLLIARNNLALVEAERENYNIAIVQMKCFLILSPDTKNAQKAQDKIDGWEVLMEL